MSNRLEGRVAVVTGGLGGLGRAQADALAAEGARVIAADQRGPAEVAGNGALGPGIAYRHLDVTSEESWDALAATVRREYGRLDVLSNTAGVGRLASIKRESAASYMSTIAVNQLGVFLGMKAAAQLMTNGGSIINVASVQGLNGQVGGSAYVSSKFAVRGLTKVGALELARYGIRVNAILPGVVDTEMVRAQGVPTDELDRHVPWGRIAQPVDVARVAVFLASDDSAYMTGSELVVDGGVTAKSHLLGERHDVISRRPG